jgi:pilus assembly protein Flp/PilA
MLVTLLSFLARYLPKNEKGQDLTEYGLLVALIAIVVLVAVVFFGDEVSTFFSIIGATVSGWTP